MIGNVKGALAALIVFTAMFAVENKKCKLKKKKRHNNNISDHIWVKETDTGVKNNKCILNRKKRHNNNNSDYPGNDWSNLGSDQSIEWVKEKDSRNGNENTSHKQDAGSHSAGSSGLSQDLKELICIMNSERSKANAGPLSYNV
jgi:hypothetical protein